MNVNSALEHAQLHMFLNSLSAVPARLRADLTLHRFAMIIDKVPFFHGVREDAVVDICAKLKVWNLKT